jgi:hypothetical protein
MDSSQHRHKIIHVVPIYGLGPEIRCVPELRPIPDRVRFNLCEVPIAFYPHNLCEEESEISETKREKFLYRNLVAKS